MACRQDFASIPAMRPRAVLLSLQNRPLKMEEAKWTEKTLRSLQKSIERQSSAPTKTPARLQHRSLIQTRKRRFGTRNSCHLWLPPRPLYSFGTRKRSCNEIPERNIGLIQATLLRDDVGTGNYEGLSLNKPTKLLLQVLSAFDLRAQLLHPALHGSLVAGSMREV